MTTTILQNPQSRAVNYCQAVADRFYSTLVNVCVDDGLWDIDPLECFNIDLKQVQAEINELCAARNYPSTTLSITYKWIHPWFERFDHESNVEKNFRTAFTEAFFESDFSKLYPTLHTDGLTSIDCPVVDITEQQVNDLINTYLRDGYIALPVTATILSEVQSKKLQYIINRGAYLATPESPEMVYTTILISPHLQNKKQSITIEQLQGLGRKLIHAHNQEFFLFGAPGAAPQFINFYADEITALAPAQAEAPITAYISKLYGLESFTHFYHNASPGTLYRAYKRFGEILIRVNNNH